MNKWINERINYQEGSRTFLHSTSKKNLPGSMNMHDIKLEMLPSNPILIPSWILEQLHCDNIKS